MTIGIAVLGAGIFAKEAHLPALAEIAKAEPGLFELKAVYSRSQSSSESLAASAKETLGLGAAPRAYYDVASGAGGAAAPATEALSALLAREDIGAVVVILPITMQPDVVLAALEAGKHVISEKPVAKDVKSGVELIATYRSKYLEKGLIWRVAENFEAEDAYRKAAELIREGRIGDVQTFEVRVVAYIDESSKYYKTPWRTTPEYQGGFLLDGGVHFAAALRTILAGTTELASLSGHASLSKQILAPHDGVTASVRAANGAHGLARITFGAPHPDAGAAAFGGNTFVVSGSRGWVSVGQAPVEGPGARSANRVALSTVEGQTRDAPGTVRAETFELPTVGVPRELESFLRAAAAGGGAGADDGSALGDPCAALKDVAFVEACLRSDGRPVDLARLAATGEVA